MKMLAVCLCACVAVSLAAPWKEPAVQKAGLDVAKVADVAVKAGDLSRDWRQGAEAKADWSSTDVKKTGLDQDWQSREQQAASDSNAKTQDWEQASSGNNNAKDASNKHWANNAAAVADKEGDQKWSASNNYDHDKNWADRSGWRKGNRRHEGINYGFDKKFARNANENGGYSAGNKLSDRASDDWLDKSSGYEKSLNEHSARSGNQDSQSADRRAGYGNAAWNNQAKADKHGRDADTSGHDIANNRDWAEKRDDAFTNGRYQEDQSSRAYDALNDKALADKNARRSSVDFAAQDNDVYGKPYVAHGVYPYGYAGKGVVVAKDLDKKQGGDDRSSLWDQASRDKNQHWQGANNNDLKKNSALANQWQQDEVNGFNKDQAKSLSDHGYARDASSKNQGGNAHSMHWADADSAKQAGQQRHDLDENVKQSSNQKWRQSDRDNSKDEWKKFFNNDQQGGQNWERLKYKKDQTDDAASADFAKKYDDANRWQDSHRFDSKSDSAKGANWANSADAANRRWGQDGAQAAAAAANQAADQNQAQSKARWGADNDRRKNGVEQTKTDMRENNQNQWDRDTQKQGYDAQAVGAGKHLGGFGYNYGGYPASYGYNNYGGYAGYPAKNNYYGGYPAYGAHGGYGKGYGGFGNYGYGYPNNGVGYGYGYY